MNDFSEIPIGEIIVGEHDQRLDVIDDELDGLVSSIGRLGQLYPCVVLSQGDKFTLVEGHRRLAACKRLGKKTVSCLVKDSKKETAAEIAFAGNFFRKDLSPVELSSALKDAVDRGTMGVAELAAGFHRSEHWVRSMMAICVWPADVQKAIHNEQISVSAASNLSCITDDSYRGFLVRNAIEQGATARTTAAWLQAWQSVQPVEEALKAEPVAGLTPIVPLVPQAPCFLCSKVFPVNEMSHLPVCGGCIQTVRQAGASGG